MSRIERLKDARLQLDEAIKILDSAHATWSECVTSLHLAELHMRAAQKRMRESYNAVADVLNGEG